MKLEPRKNEADMELFRKYGALGYPTLVLADAEGNELDRLSSFMPPEDFITEIKRIQSGDTFAARLAKFDESPADAELLQPVVDGLISRADFSGAFSRIDAFQASDHGLEPDPSLPLLVQTMAIELEILYRRVARQYRAEWQEMPDLTDARSVPALIAFLHASPAELEREEQAGRLRQARHEDAGRLLELLPADSIPQEMLTRAADFAFENGHYQAAVDIYMQWYADAGDSATPAQLNSTAWNLLLCRSELETAVTMARAAYAGSTEPHIADTLASLLYTTGATEEAIEIESKALAQIEAEEGPADDYRKTVELMKAGEELDLKPGFDSFPGD
jgi:tetratricopeptide (TPR) repeat protein